MFCSALIIYSAHFQDEMEPTTDESSKAVDIVSFLHKVEELFIKSDGNTKFTQASLETPFVEFDTDKIIAPPKIRPELKDFTSAFFYIFRNRLMLCKV